MSHISTVKTKIVNREYLLLALKDLNYSFEEGNFEIGGIGGRRTSAQIRIIRPWSLDIGLRERNGVFEVVADWWGVLGITKDEFISQLTQQYAYRATLGALAEKGFALAEEQRQPDGNIHLVLRKVG